LDLSENKKMPNKEISDYLNQNGYKTIRGNKDFYPKLIWSIFEKLSKKGKVEKTITSSTKLKNHFIWLDTIIRFFHKQILG